MRRFLLKLMAFGLSFAILVGGLEASAALWLTAPTQATMDALKYRDLFDRTRRQEHLVIGTSHAVYGVEPGVLARAGLPVYNFGYRNATPRFYRDWYALFERLHGAPRSVIFAVDWFIFTDHTNQRLETHSRFFPRDVFWSMLAERPGRAPALIANRFTLYADRARMKGALLGNQVGHHDLARFDQGYLPYANDAGAHRMRPWDDGERVEAYREDFERTLDAMARGGVRVVLVQIPELLPVAGEHPRQNAELAAIAARRGLPFLNYNGERRGPINEDKAMFYDWAHLNAAGCRRFSETLARDLRALPAYARTTPPPPAR